MPTPQGLSIVKSEPLEQAGLSIISSEPLSLATAQEMSAHAPTGGRPPVMQARGVTDPASVRVTEPPPPEPPVQTADSFFNAKTGRWTRRVPFGQGALDKGPQQIGRGLETLASVRSVPKTQAERDVVYGAVSDVIQGTFKTAAPTLPAALLASPVGTVFVVASAMLAGKTAEEATELAGGSPKAQEASRDVAALMAGGWGAKKVLTSARGGIRKLANDARAVKAVKERWATEATGGKQPEGPRALPEAEPVAAALQTALEQPAPTAPRLVRPQAGSRAPIALPGEVAAPQAPPALSIVKSEPVADVVTSEVTQVPEAPSAVEAAVPPSAPASETPPAVTEAPNAERPYTSDEEAGLRAWAEGRAYIDGAGNYRMHSKEMAAGVPVYRGKGPIAPWNKAAKARFRNSDELHQAAKAYAPNPTRRK
jgi:hypothetical protein